MKQPTEFGFNWNFSGNMPCILIKQGKCSQIIYLKIHFYLAAFSL